MPDEGGRSPLRSLRHSTEGVDNALHTAHIPYAWRFMCVCDLHTRVCRPTPLAGRPLSLREALQGPNRAWEPCPQQGHIAHTVCSMCVARTHVCAGLHTMLGGLLSLREALLGLTRARGHCPQRLLSYMYVYVRRRGRKRRQKHAKEGK